MKFKKIKTLNEAVADVSDINYGVVNHTYANAIRQNKITKERIEKAFEERNIQMPNEAREAHAKNLGNNQMKKMYLSESLFTEWVEDKEPLIESFAQPNFAVAEDQYVLDDVSGNITVGKDIFSDYIKDGHVNILFVDEAEDGEDKVLEYKMIAEDDSNIIMEYVGVATPGIDEEVADCQKYPIEKPEAKDSTYVSAEDKQPKDTIEVKDSQYVSASDKQPEKAAMKEGFTNWDSPESRVERYFTDLPGMIMTLQDHYDAGRVAADELAKALAVAYDALENVPHMDESLEASQKYPIEKPEAKDSQFISAEDKTPASAVDAKNSSFVSAQDKMPNEANKIEVKESFLVEADEKEEEGVYIYKSKRDPLADIIQVELTEGEWGYVKYPDGRTSPTRLPSANYLDDRVGADWDKNDKYAITVLGESADDLQKAIDIAVKYGKEYRLEHLSRPIKGNLKVRIWIYVDEDKDFDEPYESDVETITDNKEDESLEDSQKYPIESPMDKKDSVFVKAEQKYPIESPIKESIDLEPLNELRISTEGLANFKPYGEAATITWDTLSSKNKLATFEFMLEDMYPNGIGSTQLNDLLAYNRDWIYDMLGISESEDTETNPQEEKELVDEKTQSNFDDDFDW